MSEKPKSEENNKGNNNRQRTGEPISEKKAWVQVEKYVQLGITLPAATVLGWLIGSALDRWLHTEWIYLAGLVVGIAAGFVQLIRVALSAESKE